MNNGLIEQFGPPKDLYHAPRTRFVAGFIGSPAMNFLDCRLEQSAVGLTVLLADGLSFSVPADRTDRYRPSVGKSLLFGLRPEHITEARDHGREEKAEFTVNMDVVETTGMETIVFFMIGGAEVCGRVESSSAVEPGQSMRLQANLSHMHLIDRTTNLVI